MAASLNNVQLIGFVGRDPETRYMTDGTAVVNFSLATSFKKRDGTEETEWHRIAAYERIAEIISEGVRKGSCVYIAGRLRTRKWEDDGKTRYATEIVAVSMQFLDRRDAATGTDVTEPRASKSSSTKPVTRPATTAPLAKPGSIANMEDDIPF
jgi:single-strand DNA-binding protein